MTVVVYKITVLVNRAVCAVLDVLCDIRVAQKLLIVNGGDITEHLFVYLTVRVELDNKISCTVRQLAVDRKFHLAAQLVRVVRQLAVELAYDIEHIVGSVYKPDGAEHVDSENNGKYNKGQ